MEELTPTPQLISPETQSTILAQCESLGILPDTPEYRTINLVLDSISFNLLERLDRLFPDKGILDVKTPTSPSKEPLPREMQDMILVLCGKLGFTPESQKFGLLHMVLRSFNDPDVVRIFAAAISKEVRNRI
jgi:hypothetical protein